MPYYRHEWDPPRRGQRKAPDPAEFEFVVDEGFKYIGDGRSVVNAAEAHGDQMTDDELLDHFEDLQAYFDGIAGYAPQQYARGTAFKESSFPRYMEKYEPRRVCRRLQLLSKVEHHEQDNEQVFSGSA